MQECLYFIINPPHRLQIIILIATLITSTQAMMKCMDDKGIYTVNVKIHIDSESAKDIASSSLRFGYYDGQPNSTARAGTSTIVQDFIKTVFNAANTILNPSNVEVVPDFSSMVNKTAEELNGRYCHSDKTIINMTEQFMKDRQEPINSGERHLLILKCGNKIEERTNFEHFAYRDNCGGVHGILLRPGVVLNDLEITDVTEMGKNILDALGYKILIGIFRIFSSRNANIPQVMRALLINDVCLHTITCIDKSVGFGTYHLGGKVELKYRDMDLKPREEKGTDSYSERLIHFWERGGIN